jgi:hypothetical protein
VGTPSSPVTSFSPSISGVSSNIGISLHTHTTNPNLSTCHHISKSCNSSRVQFVKSVSQPESDSQGHQMRDERLTLPHSLFTALCDNPWTESPIWWLSDQQTSRPERESKSNTIKNVHALFQKLSNISALHNSRCAVFQQLSGASLVEKSVRLTWWAPSWVPSH